jgi:thiamine pyrophosphate-dependent acetolactate synthase large subunit-like protein
MQLGCLSTVAGLAPRNLAVLVFDNGAYQITGGQPTPAAAAGADLMAVARGCGLGSAAWAADEAEFERMLDRFLSADGPHVVGLKLDDAPPAAQTERDPAQIRDRFMRGLGAKRSALPG